MVGWNHIGIVWVLPWKLYNLAPINYAYVHVTCIIQFCLIDFFTIQPLLCKYTAEEKHSNVANCSHCDYGPFHAGNSPITTFHRSKDAMVLMDRYGLLCILWGKQFEETFDVDVWISIFSSRQFVGTFENTPLREGKTMQPVSIYIHRGRQFEDAFENTQWRKADLMNRMG